jgi:DNA repair photolyase
VLTGIAKLAREGAVLAEKARVEYRELPSRRLLSRCAAGTLMPFQWTVNPYRGCEFGCKYCYARYTHEFMELRDSLDFERLIFAKTFHRPSFVHELRAVKPGEWIAIGTATDPYQPAERRYGRTRALLEVFAARRGYGLAITTKSDLIARDTGLLAQIAKGNRLRVNMTVTTRDGVLARLLAPMAPRPALRLAALRTLSDAGIDTAVFCSPVLPGINDARPDLDALARASAAAGARSFGAQVLFLKDCARAVMLPFLDEKFPQLALAYRRTYARGAYLKGEYPERLKQTVAELRAAHGLTRKADVPPSAAWGQMDLFEVR